ncbi:MAG TPA: ferritin family protein [Gaiellaceae bacterium]|nr:ferritin family protein [Gaiellaceae bacterium]
MLAALQGEAFAYARYSLFAAAARERGAVRLASLFDGLAAVELDEHFAELADLAGLVGSDADNLRVALEDENTEAAATYPRYAAEARARGDAAAAERFAELAEDELGHAKTLEGALERLEVPA